MKQFSSLILIGVIFLSVVAAFFISPFSKPFSFGKNTAPWKLGLDLIGGAYLVYEADMSQVDSWDRDLVINGLKDVIEKRINLFGVSEPQVIAAKERDNYRLIVELAGIKDIQSAINEIGATPLLDFREVVGEETSTQFIATQLTGRYIKNAQVNFDQTTGAPQVDLQFNDEGSKVFEDLTAKNIGKPLAIFLDNNPIEIPVVREKISGGKAQITGKFTADQAKSLVERFNAGALPAPIKIISQQTIGASLGQESLKKAIYAGLLGTIIIIVFMIAYYRKLGVFASVALIVYILLTAAVFKLAVTMTLAGIAGFILSIGMAVDANILIFERTKEELKKGLVKVSAIDEGFRRAWPSIRDSNISTIITSVILYEFTTSFVKGFALTLLIGVLISMFSAITVTRLLLRTFIKNSHT
ncbi:MAG: protein translocase subunit SecD [Patescibacteria group bacterium]|nr:protein translocase subunit SecD [Patescibacteria group bacterium]